MISIKPLKPVLALMAITLLSAGLTSVPVRDAAAQNVVVTKSINAPFDKVVTKLKRQIAAHKLVIVKVVPYQKMVAMVGLKAEAAKGFEIFHPRYGKVIFKKDANAMIEVPLRIVLRKEGGKVLLQYRKPSSTFAPYSKLSGLGKELDKIFADIVARVAK